MKSRILIIFFALTMLLSCACTSNVGKNGGKTGWENGGTNDGDVAPYPTSKLTTSEASIPETKRPDVVVIRDLEPLSEPNEHVDAVYQTKAISLDHFLSLFCTAVYGEVTELRDTAVHFSYSDETSGYTDRYYIIITLRVIENYTDKELKYCDGNECIRILYPNSSYSHSKLSYDFSVGDRCILLLSETEALNKELEDSYPQEWFDDYPYEIFLDYACVMEEKDEKINAYILMELANGEDYCEDDDNRIVKFYKKSRVEKVIKENASKMEGISIGDWLDVKLIHEYKERKEEK